MAQKFIVPITIKQLASASSDALTVSIDGDSYGRVKIEAGGRLSWGDGGGTFDTNLYRDSANTLATDDVLKAIAGVVTLAVAGAPTAALPNGALAVDTTNNVFYFRSNSTWTQVSADGGASVTVSDTAPVSPEVGDLWFDSSVLELYIYYSSAWVELTLNGAEDISDLYDVNITSPTSGQVLEYDGLEWINSTLTKSDVGLGNVDNTSNSTERAATATLTNKTLTSPVINTPTGIVKGDVGLGLVDNTADTAKPVSTAQQTALDLKANLASPTFTGTVTVPTPTNNTDAATKAYTDAIVTAAKIITAAGGDGTNGQALTTNGAGTLDFTTIVGTTEASIISAVGADGAAGSVLKTNGSGDLSFGDVALGTNTSGSYVASLVAGTGVTLTNNSGEGATPTVAIGQAVATNSNVTFNDLIVSGNLTVSGTTTSINTETVTVDDNIIILNNNATGSPTENAGIEVERGTSANVLIRWNETSDKWEFTNDGSTYSILGTGGATVSDTAPTSPITGDFWFESDTAKTFIYYDSQWIEVGAEAPNGASALTTKGDLLSRDASTFARLAVGTNGYFLKADSTTSTGLVWAAIPTINNLDDIGDVTITSLSSGQVLKWNGTAWANAADNAGTTISSIDDITDVTITSVQNGDLLKWNGTAWVNAAGYALLASPTFTGTVTIPTGASITAPTGLVKGDVGLGNVDNTSNSTERAATATLTNKTLTSPVINTPTGIVKGDVGLGNVDNTSDANKPVSTAQQTALDLKANLASPTFTGTVTVPTPTNNTDASTKAYVDSTASTTAGTASTALSNHEADTTNIHGIADTSILVTTTGSQTLTNKTITSPSGLVKGDVGLGNADNTSDANKPVSTATQTALDLKAPLASPTFTGTVAGITSTMVGLGNVNNTTDANKPISTATQTALDLKSNLASPTFTGTLTANDVTVSGNLTVSGTTTSINTETLTVNDNIVVLNNNVTSSPTEDAGIEVERGTSTNVLIRWNETTDKWQFTNDGSTYSDLGAGGASVSSSAPSTPTSGQIWFNQDTAQTFVYYGSVWVEVGAVSNGARVEVSASAPASPATGDLWFDSDTAQTFTYYDSQWIEIGASGMAASIGDTAPTSPVSGQIWFDSTNASTNVYYDSQWVEVGGTTEVFNFVDAKGDLVVGTADNTVDNLAVGTNNQVLTVDLTTATGLKWSTPTVYQAVVANVSDTEIGYLDGVSSAIQTQLNTKASTGKSIAMAIVFGG